MYPIHAPDTDNDTKYDYSFAIGHGISCFNSYVNHENVDYQYYESISRNQLRQEKKFDPLVEFPRDPFYETHRSLSEMLDRYVKNGDKILDLGAGIGNVTGVLLEKSKFVTALDYSPTSLEVLRRRYPDVFEVVVSNMESLPFEDDTFDWVVCVSVLSYVNREKVESEIRRVLRPQGHLIIIDSLRGLSLSFKSH